MSEIINGYTILTKFQQAGAGQCEWAKAEKAGRPYFIKRFLRPTYPAGGLGSPATQEWKLRQCEGFEARHRDMRERLKRVSAGDGNLIVTQDFFREGAKYYKTTDWVESTAETVDDVHALSAKDRYIVALTAVYSVDVLHKADIVHGDLKPANILVKKTDRAHAAKLIDFDDSYVSGRPPSPAEVVGTPDYYSPETYRYIKGLVDDGVALTPASDVFALGIILCEYFAGNRPRMLGSDAPETIAEGVLQDTRFETGLSGGLDTLVRQMLHPSASRRPTCTAVVETLKDLKAGKPSVRSGFGAAAASSVPPPTEVPGASATITSTMRTKKTLGGTPGVGKPEAPPASSVIITSTMKRKP